MKIYTFFICLNCINIGAHNYILRVPKSTSEKRTAPGLVRSVIPLKNIPVRNRYNDVPQNEIQRLYHKYMQPVNILKEQFPKDVIEVQLEIEETNQNRNMETQKPYKLIKLHKQSNLRAFTSATKIASKAAPQALLQITSEAPLPASLKLVPQAVSLAVPQIQAVPQTQPEEQNKNRRPLYKEDLDKAFSDFELKLSSTTAAKIGANISSPARVLLRQPTQSTAGPYSIHHIVELLKKGVRMQSHVPVPTDRDLHWIQIKVPKL